METLILHPLRAELTEQLKGAFTCHSLPEAKEPEGLLAAVAPRIRAIVASGGSPTPDARFLSRFPKLEIVAKFGVGYDNVDTTWAGKNGVIVTNTPDVLTEEVADTALGLLLCTIRQLPQAHIFARAGKWLSGEYPMGESLRNRKVGIVGLGRIGVAIARRLDAMRVPVAYYSRQRKADVPYPYYSSVVDLAREVDTLVVIVPGGPETRNLINAEVLGALGPRGVLINMARGSVVDEPALIAALKNRTIHSAGLDVYVKEPNIPAELLVMEHIVTFPHVGSSTHYTRDAMSQLVFDNLLAWRDGKPPLTPVVETPYRGRR